MATPTYSTAGLGPYADDKANREAVELLDEFAQAGLKNKQIAAACARHPSHLSHVRAGTHRATTELLTKLRTLRGKTRPVLTILETCKGPDVIYDQRVAEELHRRLLDALPTAWGGAGQSFSPPAGINGVVARAACDESKVDLYVVAIRPGLGTKAGQIVAHELEELAATYRRLATPPKRPPTRRRKTGPDF